nr:hypothetical protein [uncultured Methanoregula sp.]
MMGLTKRTIIFSISFLVVALLVVQPVLADIAKTTPAVTEKMSIAYRGSGGFYIGNAITFDGTNAAGNVTLLKLTGPGLPANGLPLSDLTGSTGSGNTVDVNPDGSWRFVWYTSGIKGIEQLQTARYTVTAYDLARPEYAAATPVYLRKPEFSVTANPNVVKTGEYVQLFGTAENGVSSIKIDVTDLSGNVLRTFESAVSASGYFNNGFHVDMPPGQYQVIITNPLTKKTSWTTLTVSSPAQTTATLPVNTPVPQVTITVPATQGTVPETTAAIPPVTPATTPAAPAGNSSLPMYALAIIGGLLVICVILVILYTQKKTP